MAESQKNSQNWWLAGVMMLIIAFGLAPTLISAHYNQKIYDLESANPDYYEALMVATQMRQLKIAANTACDEEERQEIHLVAVSYLLANQDKIFMFDNYLLMAVPLGLVDWQALSQSQPEMATAIQKRLIKISLASLEVSQRLISSHDDEKQRQSRCQKTKEYIANLIAKGIITYQDINLTAQKLFQLS